MASWLADLTDERLIALLQLRPDLAQPPPGSIAALASRAQARQSITAACDDLDFLRLAVLDALLVLHADTAPVPVAKLVALIGDRAPEADVAAALADLTARALAWGDTAVRVARDAGAGLPWHPGQAILEADDRTGDQIAAAPSSICSARSTWCSTGWAPPRPPNCAAAGWGCGRLAGWPRRPASTRRRWA